MVRLSLSALVLSLLSLPALAVEPYVKPLQTNIDPKEILKIPIDRVIEFPEQKWRVIESNGTIVFVSETGRYAVKGKALDVWLGKQLNTMDDYDYAVNHINLSRTGYDVNDLNTLTLGHGPRTVQVFLDPLCTACEAFFTDAKKHLDDYTFKIVVVSALGDKSVDITKAIACYQDKNKALSDLIAKRVDTDAYTPTCNMQAFNLTTKYSNLINFKAVPFFISDDHTFREGYHPGATWAWLSDDATVAAK